MLISHLVTSAERIGLMGLFLFSAISAIALENQWPKPQLKIVAPFLPEDPKILEAGGHYGKDTLKMRERWPKGTIYVFEPNPTAYEILLKNTHAYSNIHAYPLALFTYDGYHPFYIQQNEGNDGASSLFPVTQRWRFFFSDFPTEVPCTSLNSWPKKTRSIRLILCGLI